MDEAKREEIRAALWERLLLGAAPENAPEGSVLSQLGELAGEGEAAGLAPILADAWDPAPLFLHQAFSIFRDVTPAALEGETLHASAVRSTIVYPAEWENLCRPELVEEIKREAGGRGMGELSIREILPLYRISSFSDLSRSLPIVLALMRAASLDMITESRTRTFAVDFGGEVPSPVEGVLARIEIRPPTEEEKGFTVEGTYSFGEGAGGVALQALCSAFEELAGDLVQILGLTAEALEAARATAREGRPSPSPKIFPLAFGPTPVDKDALDHVRLLSRGLVVKRRGLAQAPSWDDLRKAEVRRLLEDEGERAFEKIPGERAPRLKRGWRGDGTEADPELTAEGEKRLKITKGGGDGYYLYRDDRTKREYLSRMLQAGGGFLEVGLSWLGSGRTLAGEYGGLLRKKEEELARSTGQAEILFSEEERREEDARRARRDALSRAFTSWADASVLLDVIVRQVGKQRENPVELPAVALRELLGLEKEERWKERIEEALQSLRTLEARVKSYDAPTTIRGESSFLGSWFYVRPPGSAEGVFKIEVVPAFLGTLRAFQTERIKLPARQLTRYGLHGSGAIEEGGAGGGAGDEIEHTRYGWKEPGAAERKDLGWGSDRKVEGRSVRFEKREARGSYRQVDAGTPYYVSSGLLSKEQGRLFDWIEHNVTVRRSPVSRELGDYSARAAAMAKKRAPDADAPRLYGRAECPVLPEGRLFAGALGNFTRSPEPGRALVGRPRREGSSGGAHQPGLLFELGYDLALGRSWQQHEKVLRSVFTDLRRVVVDLLGGAVAIQVVTRAGREWIDLDEAERRWSDLRLKREEILKEARFYVFPAQDWRERLKGAWQEVQAGRAARGETSAAWTITEDPAVAARALEAQPEDNLPARLRAARIERRLSQARVAAVFEVSQRTIGFWETGERGIPEALRPRVERWIESPPAERG